MYTDAGMLLAAATRKKENTGGVAVAVDAKKGRKQAANVPPLCAVRSNGQDEKRTRFAALRFPSRRPGI